MHDNYACKLIRSATGGCDSKCRVVSVLRTHVYRETTVKCSDLASDLC